MIKALILINIFLLTSCASYVQNLHRQISRDERAQKMRQNPQAAHQQQFARASDARPINQPVTLGNYPSTTTRKNYMPSVRRNYSQSVGKRRYTADDLKDNGGDGSLWTGNNSKNFLFVTNNVKREGDIVIVEVGKSLKDKIQEELKRAFPDPIKRKSKKGKAKAATAAADKPAEPAKAPAADEGASSDKVYDKISTQVVEQLNQQYLLLRGRKEVLFKKRKRYFEFQAIVSRKDITAQDAVTSAKVLEPKINVLRY